MFAPCFYSPWLQQLLVPRLLRPLSCSILLTGSTSSPNASPGSRQLTFDATELKRLSCRQVFCYSRSVSMVLNCISSNDEATKQNERDLWLNAHRSQICPSTGEGNWWNDLGCHEQRRARSLPLISVGSALKIKTQIYSNTILHRELFSLGRGSGSRGSQDTTFAHFMLHSSLAHVQGGPEVTTIGWASLSWLLQDLERRDWWQWKEEIWNLQCCGWVFNLLLE